MRSLSGKHVLLTGAASGIGRAIAIRLASHNARLHLVDIDDVARKQLAAELSESVAADWHCDLSCSDAVDGWLDELDRFPEPVDVLINNAGVAYYGPTDAMTPEQWDWLLSVNLFAPIQITQRLLPSLLQRPDAHVVNMCSIAGLVAGGRFTAYHTSKFGLVGFTESIRAEYGRKGLGVTAVCPGPVRTKLYDSAVSGHATKGVPTPPAWACATPNRVAVKTIKAIRKNKRQVLVTPMAYGLYYSNRFAPSLIDFANQFSRSKNRRYQERLRQEELRLEAVAKQAGPAISNDQDQLAEQRSSQQPGDENRQSSQKAA